MDKLSQIKNALEGINLTAEERWEMEEVIYSLQELSDFRVSLDDVLLCIQIYNLVKEGKFTEDMRM